MFFKIGSLKNFAISTENTSVGVSFLKSFRPEGWQFYLKETSTQVFLCEYRAPPVAASDSPTTVQ